MSTQKQTQQRKEIFSFKGKIITVIIGALMILSLVIVQLHSIAIRRHLKRQETAARGLADKMDFHIARVDGVSQRIAMDRHVIDRLRDHPGLSDGPGLNRDLLNVLDAVKIAVDADIVYVMNHTGLVIASTTYAGPKTLTGNSYPFRPYFITAMQGKNTIYPALGVTTNRRGLYFSSPVTLTGQARPIGVVVIKMGLEHIDKLFNEFPNTAGLMSPDGIIFAANKLSWLYKAALPLPDQRLSIIKQNRQFGRQPLTPLPVLLGPGDIVMDGVSYTMVLQTGAIPGWKVFTLSPASGVFPVTMVVLAGFVFLLVSGLIILNLVVNRKKGILAVEHKHDREQIETQNAFLRTVMDSLAHPFYIIDLKDYSIIMANKAAGFEFSVEPPNMTCHLMTHHSSVPCGADDPNHLCPADIIKKTKKPVILEHIHKVKGGKSRHHEIHAYPIFNKEGELVQMVEYNLDITNRKRMESELIKSRQLESIGILAGGIAHDFNNMLSVIIGNIELVKDDIPPGDPNLKFLEQAEKNALKAADLSRKLITFSRGGWLDRKKLFIPLLIKQVAEDMEPEYTFDFTMEFPDSLKPVHGDERQLSQVFINILRNAFEASAEEKGDTLPAIKIEAQNLDTMDDEIVHKLQAAGITDHRAGFVKIAISDQGKGIPGESIANIFDPYWTTKKASDTKGTGLGLTLCYSIIKKHGGLIAVQSEPGKFTTVEIFLPAFSKRK